MRNLKFVLIFVILSILSKTLVWAKEIPKDLLERNVALVFKEINKDVFLPEDLKSARNCLIKIGFNLVAVHKITSTIDCFIAKKDIESKDVKYIVHMYYMDQGRSVYKLVIYENSSSLDTLFKETGKIIIQVKGLSILNTFTKLQRSVNRKIEKGLLTNITLYDKSIIDSVKMNEDGLRVYKSLIEQSVFCQNNNKFIEDIPKDLKREKVAFVEMTDLDISSSLGIANSMARNGLKKYKHKFEVFKSYKDYLKRKKEFKYRLKFIRGDVAFKITRFNAPGDANHISSYQVEKLLVSVVLINNETNEVYICSNCDFINKALNEFADRSH